LSGFPNGGNINQAVQGTTNFAGNPVGSSVCR